MGNLCSSESERVDKKEEKRAPEKLQDGADEALLPKVGAHVAVVTGEGSMDSGGSDGRSGRVESRDVAGKMLENGQCGMGGGRSVCPVIVVSSSDVETVEDDDDDNDFLKSVIAVAADTTGRAVGSARDVVAESRRKPHSEHAVSSHEAAHQAGATMSADSPGAVDDFRNSRDSFGRESGNWGDSVVKSATTAAQIALRGGSFATDDFSTEVGDTEVGGTEVGGTEVGGTEVAGTEVGGTGVVGTEVGGAKIAGSEVSGTGVGGTEIGDKEVGLIEGSVSVSISEGHLSNLAAMSTATEVVMIEESVLSSPAEKQQVFEEDDVSSVSTNAEHRVGSMLDKRDDLNNGVGLSGPLLNGSEDFGSPVDSLVGKVGAGVQLAAEDKGLEQPVLDEASGYQNSPDIALNTSTGGKTSTSSGDQIGAHEDGLESSVDARVDFRDVRPPESDHSDLVEESTQDKKLIFADVSSSLEPEVGLSDSETSSQLNKTVEAVVDIAEKSTGNVRNEVEMTVDDKRVDNFRGGDILPSAFGSQENQTPAADIASITKMCGSEIQLATDSGPGGSSTKPEDGNSIVAVSQDTENKENKEVKCGEDTSETSFVLPTLSPHTSDAEKNSLDRSLSESESGTLEDWNTTPETGYRENYVKHADDVMNEAAARDIVQSIIAKAISIICDTHMEIDMDDSSLLFQDIEEDTLAGNKPGVIFDPPQTSVRFSTSASSPQDLSPPPPPETDQSQPTIVESATSSSSHEDLIDREKLLIYPAKPAEVTGEITNIHNFDTSKDDSDEGDASIKETAWGITDKAVQEAIKIVAVNGCHFDSDFSQINSNDLDSFPGEDTAIQAECTRALPDTSLNNHASALTHSNCAKSLPAYSTQATVTPDQQAPEPEITPQEEYLAQSLSHTNKPQENDPVDIQDNQTHVSSVTPSDSEFISQPSPPTPSGEEVNSESNTRTSSSYVSKVPLFFPPLDDFSSLPDKPLIIIHSPDSAGRTGSTEDIPDHVEALI